jgi:hypothetical protein
MADCKKHAKNSGSSYTYGEFGCDREDSVEGLEATLDAAISHSIDMGPVPIGVWCEKEELCFVVVEGEAFAQAEYE